MLVVMRMDASPEQIDGVVETITEKGLKAHPIPGAQQSVSRGTLESSSRFCSRACPEFWRSSR
jgi:hypothetical protein